jgi:hypothetical protein
METAMTVNAGLVETEPGRYPAHADMSGQHEFDFGAVWQLQHLQ